MKHLVLLLVSALPAMAGGDRLWHWVDAAGQQHFSDRPQEHSGLVVHGSGQDSVSGLRPGEIERLRLIEQNAARRHAADTRQRQRNDRATEARRLDCRKVRERWHNTRDRAQRKQDSDYLRQHCW